LLSLAIAALPITAKADEVFASLGTGDSHGVYYRVGRAICDIVNPNLGASHVRCSAEPTPGSVYNIDALHSGELDFAIVQSDVIFAAAIGTGAWANRKIANLRAVFSLYPELVTIIARGSDRLQALGDLSARTVNVGPAGTGTRATWDAIEAQLGWNAAQRVVPSERRTDVAMQVLCAGTISANVLMIGHPSRLVRAVLSDCSATLVPVTGPAIGRLLAAAPYYHRGVIRADLYGLPADVPTFGTSAVLVTIADQKPQTVEAVARAVLGHVEDLRKLHPALARLTAQEMVTEGLSVPLHPAASLIYQEQGLLPK
jgi:TRAP transporter TAXI family solute receptor